MTRTVTIRIPGSLAERLGATLEEYIIEPLLDNIDHAERAREYAQAAEKA